MRGLYFCGLMLLPMRPVTAQGPTASLTTACKDAIRQVLDRGVSNVADAILFVLPQCGKAGAQVTATAVTTTRANQDTLALMRLYGSVDLWRDAIVMQAALNLTNNAQATVPARVFALRHLLRLAHPGQQFGYGQLTVGDITVHEQGSDLITPGCARMLSSEHPNTVATPLPIDFLQRIQVTISAIRSSATAPLPLRNAAACFDR